MPNASVPLVPATLSVASLSLLHLSLGQAHAFRPSSRKEHMWGVTHPVMCSSQAGSRVPTTRLHTTCHQASTVSASLTLMER